MNEALRNGQKLNVTGKQTARKRNTEKMHAKTSDENYLMKRPEEGKGRKEDDITIRDKEKAMGQ